MRITRFRQRRGLARKNEIFIKDKDEIANKVDDIKILREVLCVF